MRIKFNEAGFDELLTSAAANALVKGYADDIAERANAVPSTTDPATDEPYYKVWEAGDGTRARYRVATASGRAQKHEAKTQALEKSL